MKTLQKETLISAPYKLFVWEVDETETTCTTSDLSSTFWPGCIIFCLWLRPPVTRLSNELPSLRSHSRLQPAAQDPELRGGPRSGPDQREDAPASRQQAVRGAPLRQQPAGQHRTPGQQRHQCSGLVPPPRPPLRLSSSSPASFPSPPSSGGRGRSVRMLIYFINE